MVEDERARLCPNCGAVLPGAAEPSPSAPLQQMQAPPPPLPPQQESSGNQVVKALLIAVLIIIGLGVLLFLGLLLLCSTM